LAIHLASFAQARKHVVVEMPCVYQANAMDLGTGEEGVLAVAVSRASHPHVVSLGAEL
jgi:hypothetical protein